MTFTAANRGTIELTLHILHPAFFTVSASPKKYPNISISPDSVYFSFVMPGFPIFYMSDFYSPLLIPLKSELSNNVPVRKTHS